MPNKTLYIRDEDLPIWERADKASKAAGVSTSQVVADALRNYLPNPKDIQVAYETGEDASITHDGRPLLEYGRHAAHGRGWTLNYMDKDDPGGTFIVEDEFTPGDLGDSLAMIKWAREKVAAALADPARNAEKITVEVGDPALTVGFRGRWLVTPDRDDTRTSEKGYDAGAYWGVALTERGRIAVYSAHCNDGWAPQLDDYDALRDAEIPADIRAMAARELGETTESTVVWRDI
ncbi:MULTISPECIES: hypothetical protein [unclassified Nocardiopsis]|uniref:hypothetical protein n=1 Tax=Nocardiopsis TaxID=2013 RepID=UPI00387B5F54